MQFQQQNETLILNHAVDEATDLATECDGALVSGGTITIGPEDHATCVLVAAVAAPAIAVTTLLLLAPADSTIC